MNITSIGAIPVGLKLKFNGYPLVVKAQYNLDGKVVLQLWDEDGNQKASIVNTSDVEPVTNIIASHALSNIKRDSKEYKSQRMVIKNMMKNLAGEVVDHNKKSKSVTPKRPAMKKPAAAKFKVGDIVQYKGAKTQAKVLSVKKTGWENYYVIQFADNGRKEEAGETSLEKSNFKKKPAAKKPSPAVNCSTFGSDLRTKKTSAAGRNLVKLCRWDKK